ncbi:uncharacterized protein LOC129303715 isoform X2 [Prosopis cineraria]|uniref:uncharacterized protein LOC129303715 isoform X2 n=1 Tax=Prosopis cineraria TaxID=364024 RepID=UPI0024107BAB|nr:uncharacterized protein LOC129303715 isoform X2 [Prosopis cineraria]
MATSHSVLLVGTSSSPSTVAQINSQVPTMTTKVTPLLSNLNQAGAVKLDRTNYILWSSHVLSIVRGHRLDGYLLGLKQCPNEYTVIDEQVQVNSEYEDWIATDQLLYDWLLGSMNTDCSPYMMNTMS